VTSAGQRHDSLAFIPLMSRLRIARPGRILADKAYSSRAIRSHLRKRRIRPTIPRAVRPGPGLAQRRQGRPPEFDPGACRHRNTVERAFCRLRQHRAVATQYDKRDFIYRGTVDAATIRIRLRDLTGDDLRGGASLDR